MNIGVIIPNYNGEELLKKNLPKVLEAISSYKDGKIEIIVVDDGSEDKSKAFLRDFASKTKFDGVTFKTLENEKNLGFSSAINNGVKESFGDIIILLNTDVCPEKDFYKPLIQHFSDPQVFAVGCMDKSLENGKIVLRGRGVGKWQRGFLIHKRGNINKTNTLWASGGSSAFRKNLWDKFNGFNNMYNPAYWEDIDLSYRALKSGYKVIFEKQSVVMHEHEKGSIKRMFTFFEIKTISYRNQFYFVWNNISDIDLILLHILFLPYHFVKALLIGDWAFFLGFFKAFLHFKNSIKSNISSRKISFKKDKEITIDFDK